MSDDFGQLVEPAPVRFSFGAPGWYVLGVLLLLLVITVLLWLRHYLRKNHYRKTALQWLALQEQQPALPEARIYAANMLLKRVAMRNYGRARVASVTGKDWILLLNHTARKTVFDEDDAVLVSHSVYMPAQPTTAQAEGFTGKTKKWIKQHRHAFRDRV